MQKRAHSKQKITNILDMQPKEGSKDEENSDAYRRLISFILLSSTGEFALFCANCGEDLPESANFCLKCGVRTKKGAKDRVQTPYAWVNLTDQLDKIGQEIEKALSEAGKEMERAFKTVTDTIREATTRKPLVCSNCGEESPADARFCYKCGKKLR